MAIRRYLGALKGGISDFLTWWPDELLGMLPDHLSKFVGPRLREFEIHLNGSDLCLRFFENGREQGQKSISWESLNDTLPRTLGIKRYHEATIDVGETRILHTATDLPLSHEKKIAQILKFRVSSLFPFPEETSLIAYRLSSETKPGRVCVEVLGFRRTDRIGQLAKEVAKHAVDLILRYDGRSFQLISEFSNPRRNFGLGGRASHILAVIILIIGLLGAYSWRSGSEAEEFVAMAAMARQEAADLIELQRRISSQIELTETAGRILEKTRIARVIEELSLVIPDGAWLVNLDIDGAQVSMRGFAADLPDLLAWLEESEVLNDVQLLTSRISDPDKSRREFEVEAIIKDGGGSE